MKASVSKEGGCAVISVVTSAPSPDSALLASEIDAWERHCSRRPSDCDRGNHATSKLKPSPAPLSDSRVNCPFGVSILHVCRADPQPARAPAGYTIGRVGCQLSSQVPNVYFLKAGLSRTKIFRLPPSSILKVMPVKSGFMSSKCPIYKQTKCFQVLKGYWKGWKVVRQMCMRLKYRIHFWVTSEQFESTNSTSCSKMVSCSVATHI